MVHFLDMNVRIACTKRVGRLSMCSVVQETKEKLESILLAANNENYGSGDALIYSELFNAHFNLRAALDDL